MSEAGILKVVEERAMRGATERVYVIAPENAHLSPDEIAAMTPEEHERLFSTFTAMLLGQFHNYIQQAHIDLAKDGVSYRTVPLYLSDPEFAEMWLEMRAIVTKRLENEAAPERRRRLLSLVIMPDVHSD